MTIVLAFCLGKLGDLVGLILLAVCSRWGVLYDLPPKAKTHPESPLHTFFLPTPPSETWEHKIVSSNQLKQTTKTENEATQTAEEIEPKCKWRK